MAAHGRYVYMADRGQSVVRRLDTVTGIQTVAAGNGLSNSYRPPVVDGERATSTLLGDVYGLAVDDRGDLYISDSSRRQIYRVDGSGRIWVVAGNGTDGDAGDGGAARDASLSLMFTMGFDGSGHLYVSTGPRIRRITPSGTITTVAGGQPYDPEGPRTPDGAPAVGAGMSPIGFAVDPSGILYVPDRGVVRKVDERGILSTFASGIDAYCLIPRPEGGLYASSSGGVSSIDPTGRVTTVGGGLGAANSLAVDADGNLYVAEFSGFRVRMVAPDGSIRIVAGSGTDDVGDGGQASDAILRFARDVAFDGRGIGYVTEDAYNRVRRVDRSGVLTTFAGSRQPGFAGDGGPATAAALNGPTRVVADGGGTVYVLDSNNRRVRRVDRNGIITTVAGNGGSGQYGTGDGGPATAATLGYVADLALDGAGNLYLSGGARVRKVDALGIITTVAGTGEAGFSGDGGPATAARLGSTTGIDVDASGTLAIVDFGRIRRVTPDGRITTIATLITPSSIASDRAGGWFVAGRNQVHRINGSGKVLVAGTGEAGQNDDVGPATRAPLTGITGIAFDGTDLFIAVQTRVRRVAMAASSPPAPAASPAAGWGMNTYGQTSGSPATNPVLAPSGAVETTALAAGWFHSLAVTSGGGVRAWGWNDFGQLGRGTTTGSTAIHTVPGLSNIRSVAAGGAHSLALKEDGTVWAWGYNGQGQLGTGSTTDSWVPVQVAGLTGVVAIAAGGFHSLAVDSGGRVHAWGWNGVGALGQGHTSDRPLPTAVPFNVSSDAVGVAGGAYHSLVVWRDGTVWSFGWNGLGQLGNGSTTDSSRPARIPGLNGVAEAAGGIAHSLARGYNGEVWAWGWNALGQLGDGTTNDGRTPVPVTGLTNVRSVAAGGYHSLAVLDTGAVRSWGWNGLGQLGTGSTADSLRPTPASTAGKTEVAAGAAHSLTR